MSITVTPLWGDYVTFHRAAIRSRDVDPVYPVLKVLYRKLDDEAALWMSVLFLTYYHMGSALRVWEETLGQPSMPKALGAVPTATERRGNRDVKQLERNLRGWLEATEAAGSLWDYLLDDLPGEPGEAWLEVRTRIEAVHGNGRWAAYKMAEILQKAHDVALLPLDMGHAFSSGPRQGMALLAAGLPEGNTPAAVRRLDAVSEQLLAGLHFRGLEARVEEAETTLCDFHALVAGRYYVGHDIDAMYEQLAKVRSDLTEAAIDARLVALPHEYLGEAQPAGQGWQGVDPARRFHYKRTGEILER